MHLRLWQGTALLVSFKQCLKLRVYRIPKLVKLRHWLLARSR